MESQAAEAKGRLEELREELGKTEAELVDARAALETAEEERKALLLREAQAQKEPPPAEAAKPSCGELEWSKMCNIIKERAIQLGVHPELCGQIGTALDLLRTLCGQLPAQMANEAAATQAAPGSIGQSDPAAEAAQLGREIAAQIKRDMAVSAAARKETPTGNQAGVHANGASSSSSSQLQQQQQLQATPQQQHQPSQQRGQQEWEARALELAFAENIIGHAAPPAEGAMAPKEVLASAPSNSESLVHWAANASAAELAKHYNNSDFEDLAEDSADSENDAEFVDAALDGAEPEQRNRLREILERRRTKTAQRRSGPKRLEKAGKLREPLAGESVDAKKPTKGSA